MCRNTLLKSRALHSYSMNCRTYQNHKRKSNPSKQSGSVNIDWTGAAVVKVRGAMDRQFFLKVFMLLLVKIHSLQLAQIGKSDRVHLVFLRHAKNGKEVPFLQSVGKKSSFVQIQFAWSRL